MRSREECRKGGGRRNETHDTTKFYILNGRGDKNGEEYLWKFWKLYVYMYMRRRDIFESLILRIVVLTRDDRSKNKFLTFDSTALQHADSRPLGL